MADQPTGQGAPQSPTGASGEAPQAITIDAVNEAISKAFGARNKDIERRLDTKLSELTSSFSSKLEETLAAKLEAFKSPAPTGQDDKVKSAKGKEEAAAPSFLDTPEGKALQKRLAEADERSKRFETEANAAKARAEEQSARQSFAEAAAPHKIDSTRSSILYNHLVATGRIVRGSDGVAMGKGDDGDPVELRSFLDAYVKTDEGKLLLPPSGAAGSGDRPQSGNAPRGGVNGKITRSQLGELIARRLAGQ